MRRIIKSTFKLEFRIVTDLEQGSVKFYNDVRGYGFVIPDRGGVEIFFHVSALRRAGMSNPTDGDRVEFSTQSSPHGKGQQVAEIRFLD
jgi:CspA family cold shock protein